MHGAVTSSLRRCSGYSAELNCGKLTVEVGTGVTQVFPSIPDGLHCGVAIGDLALVVALIFPPLQGGLHCGRMYRSPPGAPTGQGRAGLRRTEGSPRQQWRAELWNEGLPSAPGMPADAQPPLPDRWAPRFRRHRMTETILRSRLGLGLRLEFAEPVALATAMRTRHTGSRRRNVGGR
jgi:hypothetical protein